MNTPNSLPSPPKGWTRFGVGMRPALTDEDTHRAAEALRTLLLAAPERIAIPIITHVMAGPLANLGLRSYVAHVFGRTGTFKTSYSMACLSIFGMFDEDSIPMSWNSTSTSLGSMLYHTRDLTTLVDDYKKSSVRSDVIGFVQNLADRTARMRGSPSQKVQPVQQPRGLVLSTGEDWIEKEQSAAARTLMITMKQGDVSKGILKVAQAHAKAGSTAIVGGTWVSWLARQGLTNIQERLEGYRDAVEALPAMHARSAANITTMLSVVKLVQDFLDECLPEVAGLFRESAERYQPVLIEESVADDLTAQQLSPFRKLVEAVRDAVSQETARLIEIDKGVPDSVGGGVNVPSIGYFDYNYVYLNEGSTFKQWYEPLMLRAGEHSTVSWIAFRQEALTEHSCIAKQMWGRGGIRCILIPYKTVFPTEEQ